MKNYHGILVDHSFSDPKFINSFNIINSKQDGSWLIVSIEVSLNEIDKTINSIQANMLPDKPFYNHLYDEDNLIIIFKDKVFYTDKNQKSWNEIFNYANSLNIPSSQLDFIPNRFEDEVNYFNA